MAPAAAPPALQQQQASDARYSMHVLEKKLNAELGFHWWKMYSAAAFWSNVSTPTNLAITMFTALTTAQASAGDFMPRHAFVGLSVATLIVSVLNTFFRPHAQMSENIKLMNQWTELGTAFEEVFYSPCDSDDDHRRRLADYRMLLQRVLALQSTQQTPETQNFLTDLLHLMARVSCLRRRDRWLDLDVEAINAGAGGAGGGGVELPDVAASQASLAAGVAV